MNDDLILIAILVARLGGSVQITPHEMLQFHRPTMRKFMMQDTNCLVLEVEMPPPDAIDAEFEVVADARQIGGPR